MLHIAASPDDVAKERQIKSMSGVSDHHWSEDDNVGSGSNRSIDRRVAPQSWIAGSSLVESCTPLQYRGGGITICILKVDAAPGSAE
jgi:hypothetical protein